MSMIACSAAWSTCVTKSLARFEVAFSPPPSSAARLMIEPARRAARTAMLSMGCMGRVFYRCMPPIRIVLCRPSHPGNIGAAARAMKAMGLTDLRLVAPERYPAKEEQWLATNAVDVLHAATVHATLQEAVKDCVAAFALSARPREWSPQVLDVRNAAAPAVEMDSPVAFVFGNEAAGLTHDTMIGFPVPVDIP